MPLYLVSYDLRKPEQDYLNLIASLQKLGAKRVLRSQWVLKSTATAKQIIDALVKLIDANDRMLVNELTLNTSWFNLMISDAEMQALFT